MESRRQQKFAKLIQKELSDVFMRDVPELVQGAFVTVTIVRISPDLSVAKIYLSVLASSDPSSVVKTMQESSKAVRFHLGNRIRNQVRIIPELVFYLDDSQEYAQKIDRLMSGLNIPPAPKNEDE
jgi:ribosome-binding factor A